METETARLIEILITAGGLILWATGLGFTVRTLREPPAPDPDNPGHHLAQPPNMLAGRVETQGRPDEILPRLIEVFSNKLTGGGRFELIERGKNFFEYSTAGGIGPHFSSGRIELRPLGSDRTEAYYRVRLAGAAAGRILAWVFLALGIGAIAFGAWIILTQVVEHPDPSVRGQVFQGFQILHFLWPPFLFAGRHRRLRKFARAQIESAIHNSQYLVSRAR